MYGGCCEGVAMVKRPRHFYEAMGDGGGVQPIRRDKEPAPPVPPPAQVVPIQNTITMRKETFIAGVIFFIVIVIVAFIVGRSTAPQPQQEERVSKKTFMPLSPTLLKGEYAILAATFPLSRLQEAEGLKRRLIEIGWTNATLHKEGETVFVLLKPYRVRETAERALEAIRETTYKGKKIFKDARLLER